MSPIIQAILVYFFFTIYFYFTLFESPFNDVSVCSVYCSVHCSVKRSTSIKDGKCEMCSVFVSYFSFQLLLPTAMLFHFTKRHCMQFHFSYVVVFGQREEEKNQIFKCLCMFVHWIKLYARRVSQWMANLTRFPINAKELLIPMNVQVMLYKFLYVSIVLTRSLKKIYIFILPPYFYFPDVRRGGKKSHKTQIIQTRRKKSHKNITS